MNIMIKLSFEEHKKLVNTAKDITEPTVIFKNANVYNINRGLVMRQN